MGHAALSGRKRWLSLKAWHDVLRHIDPGDVKHLEKGDFMEISDCKVALEMRCATCRESTSEVQPHGCGGMRFRALREVAHTDIEGPSRHISAG